MVSGSKVKRVGFTVETALCLRAVFAVVAVLFLLLPVTAMAGPEVKDILVTDVTPSAFSVVWTAGESSRIDYPHMNVFNDPDGLEPTLDIEITPFPVVGGSGVIPAMAQEKGVMKVRVSGLQSNTTYYFQTLTTSNSTNETTFYPENPPYLSVTTEEKIERDKVSVDEDVPFSNDMIIAECYLEDGVTPAEGTLLIATVEEGNYPVSAFVGDGVAPPYALIDMNNIFSRNTHKSLDVMQNTNLTLVNFRGIWGNALITYTVPEDVGLSEVKSPAPMLLEGWNMISFQLEPSDTATDEVLAPIWDKFVSIWEYDTQLDTWFRYDREGPSFLNNLFDLHAGKGYWLVLSGDTSLRIKGQISDEPVTLYQGWNLVGYHSMESWGVPGVMQNVESVLDTIWGYEASSDTWLRYSPAGNPMLNDLQWVVPGKGYWIISTGQAEW